MSKQDHSPSAVTMLAATPVKFSRRAAHKAVSTSESAYLRGLVASEGLAKAARPAPLRKLGEVQVTITRRVLADATDLQRQLIG